MIWSNWQGAIWRGAFVVVLFWSGLAWTQTPTPRSPDGGGERIMVVHENGKSTRCRVMESWQLPDGRIAHLLQALETGEMITIVDERACEPGAKGLKAVPKRIFAWGIGQRTPPKDAPLPPQLRHDSGIVIKNEAPPPAGAVHADGPLIINRVIDEKALGGRIRADGTISIINNPPADAKKPAGQAEAPSDPGLQLASGQNAGPNDPNIKNASLPDASGPPQIKNAQMIEFPNAPTTEPKVVPVGGQRPEIQNEAPRISAEPPVKPVNIPAVQSNPPLPDVRPVPVAIDPVVSKPMVPPNPAAPFEVINSKPQLKLGPPSVVPTPVPFEVINSKPIVQPTPVALDPIAPKPGVLPNPTVAGLQSNPLNPAPANVPLVGALPNPVSPGMLPPAGPANVPPTTQPIPTPLAGSPGAPPIDPTWTPTAPLVGEPSKKGPSKANDTATKKSWRPGEVLFGWMKKDTGSTAAKLEATKNEAPRKGFRADELLATQNKVAEKNIADRVDRMSKAPFSTALAQNPPEAKRPEPAPLAIPGGQKPKEQPKEQPKDLPKPEPVAAAPAPIGPAPVGPAPVGPAPLGPPPLAGLQQTAGMSEAEKRDMFGKGSGDKVELPGKSLLDPAALKADVVKLPPPPTRTNDPLMSPERYIPNDERVKPKASMLAPVANVAPAANLTPSPVEPRPAPAPLGAAPAPVPAPRSPVEYRPQPAPAEHAAPNNWPLGSQSVLAARGNPQGPVTYVPVPLMTAPQPNHPPGPPAPQMPDAPQLNAYVNAFSHPAAPKPAQPQGPSQIPQWMQPNQNAMMQQQMMQQQALMQQQILQQQMIQQQMMQHQAMLAQTYRPNAYPTNPYASYGNPTPSQGPMSNTARHYTGPMPPGNPYQSNPVMPAGYMPSNYPPTAPMHAMMPPQQPMVQQASYQPMPMQQTASGQQIEHLIKVMRESPYPAQREWAAQSLMSFEWRAHPQVVPALLSSASQDPAASVRAGCVNCLGRMGAAVEPVFGVLHGMRNDIDPRVRQEVEQAFVRLGQSPMLPQ